jgi:hypothetical membrane protein
MFGFFRYLGILGVLFFWLIILISVSLNPWFMFTHDAFSDLGGPRANAPYVYNYGLITLGAMLYLFSMWIATKTRSKLELIGASWLMIASLFLSLIGVYPSGSRPHTFVSSWFFIQTWLSMTPFLLQSFLSRNKDDAVVFSSLFILSPIIAFIVELSAGWPSVAVLEAYGVVVIDFYVIYLYYKFK